MNISPLRKIALKKKDGVLQCVVKIFKKKNNNLAEGTQDEMVALQEKCVFT